MTPPLQVLWVGAVSPGLSAALQDSFELQLCATLDDAVQAMRQKSHDALLLWLEPGMLQGLIDWQALSQAVLDAAVVVVAPDLSPELAVTLTRRGVQDLLPALAADAAALQRVLSLAVERKRLERAARKAYATDLSTGLPNHAQLLEHMTHLLALREREPAPMALLVLRIEGLSTTERALGSEAANVLRRKLAVRVRAGLRASDVVASIGNDAFAVLLAWIDTPDAAMRVAGKLSVSLQQPVRVAGQEQTVAVALGVSQYPEHGKQAEELLRRALGQASGSAALGRSGFANRVERGGEPAANDD
jgi:diguanylate cyclase (GGDEF)-like protein